MIPMPRLAADGDPQPRGQRQNRGAQKRQDHETARDVVEGNHVEKRHSGLLRCGPGTECQPKGAEL